MLVLLTNYGSIGAICFLCVLHIRALLAAPQTKTNLDLSLSESQSRNPCSGRSAVYQDLSKRHGWPV